MRDVDQNATVRIRDGVEPEGGRPPFRPPVAVVASAQHAAPQVKAARSAAEVAVHPMVGLTDVAAPVDDSLPTLLLPPPPPPEASELAVEELDDRTRSVQRVPARQKTWELLMPNGHRVEITGTVVLGRNPEVDSASTPVSVGSDQKSVSKTHARLELNNGLLTVTDLDSRFGTIVIDEVGDEVECVPGKAIRVREGWGLELGTCVIQVRRREKDAR